MPLVVLADDGAKVCDEEGALDAFILDLLLEEAPHSRRTGFLGLSRTGRPVIYKDGLDRACSDEMVAKSQGSDGRHLLH